MRAERTLASRDEGLHQNLPQKDKVEAAVCRGLARVHTSLKELSGGNFVKDRTDEGGWADFYTTFLGNVDYIFGEYTWADGSERYIVYVDRQGRVREYDDEDGTHYLLSQHADTEEIEDALANRCHKDLATGAVIPPRKYDIPTEPFKSRLRTPVLCDAGDI